MTTDLLIIGGGVTARRAARIVSKKYSVTLISDGCGASPYIHGLNVPLADSDGTELFLSDTIRSGKAQNTPSLARALVEGSCSVATEFKERFDRTADGGYDLLKPLGSSLPRVASIEGRTGVNLLRELSENKKYEELSDTRALSLIKDGERVIGAKVFDKKARVHYPIFAKCVLIASGGFGGVFRFSTNSPDIGGDGVAMAYEAGAELVDMEFIQYEPTVAISPEPLIGKSIITTMLFEGGVIRNGDGERFMDEQVEKDKLSEGIYREILKGKATKNGGVLFDMTAVPEEMLLGKYKDYFNRYKRHGIDIRQTPVEIIPAPHTTMGGIKIDAHARTTLRGLFAAGEAAGGVHGANRLGGNAGLEVLVFGDIAGRSILEFLDGEAADGYILPDVTSVSANDADFDCGDLREQLYTVTDTALGVIKSGKSMLSALSQVKNILSKIPKGSASFSAMRLYNDALTVYLVLTSALSREDSVGGHIRADFPNATEGDKYSIILKNCNGDLITKRQAINYDDTTN